MRRAFSLVELLVVIAIIAILIGLLMPTLGKARVAAWQAVESSNQGQLARAAASYSNDYRDYFNPIQDYHWVVPPGLPDQFGSPKESSWRHFLWEYVSMQGEAYDSPADKIDRYADGFTGQDVADARADGYFGEEDPFAMGTIGDQEMYNKSGIGANLVHYWSYGGDHPYPEGKGPFGRPRTNTMLNEKGWAPQDYEEGLSKQSEVDAPFQLILFASGGTDHPAYPNDTWWLYKFDGPVRENPFDRYLQHLAYESDPGAVRYDGKGLYAFADGAVKILDARDIPCDDNNCWWSVKLDAHNTPGQ